MWPFAQAVLIHLCLETQLPQPRTLLGLPQRRVFARQATRPAAGGCSARFPASCCSPQILPSHVPSATDGLPTSCNYLGDTGEFVCLLRDVLPQGAPLGGLEPLATP